jgi:membrane protein implicated in regulation of membrane protease activity
MLIFVKILDSSPLLPCLPYSIDQLPMNREQLFIVALIAIAVGIVLGIMFVLVLQVQRRNVTVNSSIQTEQLVGAIGTVEVPFDQNSKGKVRVGIKGSLVDFIALTNSSDKLELGERVLIIDVQENKIWVVPENYLTKSEGKFIGG